MVLRSILRSVARCGLLGMRRKEGVMNGRDLRNTVGLIRFFNDVSNVMFCVLMITLFIYI